MKIGNIDLKHGLMLAPMAGVTDPAFRKICRELGAEYTVTEMISAKAVYYKDKKTDELAKIYDDEHPIALQLFGSEFDIVAYAAEKLCEKYKPDAIDLNMGCPVHKIVSNGEGSALMRDRDKVKFIVKGVCNAVKVPVTVKIRAGWDENDINAADIARVCEEYGAAAICIHGRTRSEMYRPPVRLDVIKEVKRAVKIPVIGNGGIFTSEDAVRMLDYTGCDGIMLARGCQGNPWLFAEIKARLEGKSYTPPSLDERINLAIRHTEMMEEEKGERGILEARKIISWYITGVEGSAAARGRINSAVSAEQIKEILLGLKI